MDVAETLNKLRVPAILLAAVIDLFSLPLYLWEIFVIASSKKLRNKSFFILFVVSEWLTLSEINQTRHLHTLGLPDRSEGDSCGSPQDLGVPHEGAVARTRPCRHRHWK